VDFKKVSNISMLGVIENGVFMTIWYNFLARTFGTGGSTGIVLVKCMCDQIFFATQQDGCFLLLCAYYDTNNFPKALNEVKDTFLNTWLIDCALWPLVNFFGFAFINHNFLPS